MTPFLFWQKCYEKPLNRGAKNLLVGDIEHFVFLFVFIKKSLIRVSSLYLFSTLYRLL